METLLPDSVRDQSFRNPHIKIPGLIANGCDSVEPALVFPPFSLASSKSLSVAGGMCRVGSLKLNPFELRGSRK